MGSDRDIYISIIIPLFKVEHCIERCLKSIVVQKYRHFEIILIDDASPDNSQAIAKEYLNQHHLPFQIIQHKRNKKQGAARNTGLRQAKGQYILFVDSDDELAHEDVLSDYTAILQSHKYDFIESNFWVVNDNNEREIQTFTNGIHEARNLKSDVIVTSLLNKSLFVSPCNKLISKAFLNKKNILFPEEIYFEDNLWAFDLFLKAEMIYTTTVSTYVYHLTNPHSTTTVFAKDKLDDLLTIITRILSRIDNEHLLKDYPHFLLHAYIMRLVDGLLYKALTPNNMNFWNSYFDKMEKVYKKSDLGNLYAFNHLPTSLLFNLYKERKRVYESPPFFGKKIYLTLIQLMFLFSFEGKSGIFRKIQEKFIRRRAQS